MANIMLDDKREMTKRYEGSYIRVKDTNKPMLVSVFHNNQVHGQVDGRSVELDERLISLDKPKLGVFNHKDMAVFCYTTSKRHYKRGFDLRYVHIMHRFKEELRCMKKRGPTTVTKELLNEIYDPQYPSVEDALKLVQSCKRMACAFNDKFYFGLKNGSKHIHVFYKKWIVGYVEGNSIKLKSHHLYEELSKYMKVEKVQ